MIKKVGHMVRVLVEIRELTSRRFNALAGYARNPATVTFLEEAEWYATGDERVVAMVVRDLADDDWDWIILGRDERLRFRAIDVRIRRTSRRFAFSLESLHATFKGHLTKFGHLTSRSFLQRLKSCLLIPQMLAMVIVHAPIGTSIGYPVPLGFASFDTDVLERVSAFVSERSDRYRLARS
jgi:hypothetical protein